MRQTIFVLTLPLLAGTLFGQTTVDFRKQVLPELNTNCIACHGPGKAAGGFRFDTREALLRRGPNGAAVVPGKPDKSPLYTSLELLPGRPGAMPPGGPQLPKEQRDAIRQWILAGAPWPAGVVASAPKEAGTHLDEATLVRQIHDRIATNAKATKPSDMKPYKNTIPGTDASFEMVPIPGGVFTMGTSPTEAGHKKDESPQHRVRVEPFWMSKYEVTWDEYRLFMFANQAGEASHKDTLVDAVSRPTRPYVEMSFGMGIHGYPAISMTQHAASKYAEWLSAKTGQFYRLPTEAEWEYACRAGTTTAYSFGNDVSKLGQYAWYADNSNGKYQKVGTKKPNAWGLYDMEGNVSEWTLDQYMPNFYDRAAGKTLMDPWAKPTTLYPKVVRGGSWTDPPAMLRCGARAVSDSSWQMQDPQLPKSVWYLTDAQWVGFRLIRPLKVPTAREMNQFWNSSGIPNQ